mmetsp:Transcript_56130/g.99889  ORF Transcript_56130/g.99889 Transcript_56130/m.99889 type:complete len:461 (-) Transcript_56130:471-1853(-)
MTPIEMYPPQTNPDTLGNTQAATSAYNLGRAQYSMQGMQNDNMMGAPVAYPATASSFSTMRSRSTNANNYVTPPLAYSSTSPYQTSILPTTSNTVEKYSFGAYGSSPNTPRTYTGSGYTASAPATYVPPVTYTNNFSTSGTGTTTNTQGSAPTYMSNAFDWSTTGYTSPLSTGGSNSVPRSTTLPSIPAPDLGAFSAPDPGAFSAPATAATAASSFTAFKPTMLSTPTPAPPLPADATEAQVRATLAGYEIEVNQWRAREQQRWSDDTDVETIKLFLNMANTEIERLMKVEKQMQSEMEATEYLVMNKNDEIKKLRAEVESLRGIGSSTGPGAPKEAPAPKTPALPIKKPMLRENPFFGLELADGIRYGKDFVDTDKAYGALKIARAWGPAEAAGLLPGDLITIVNGVGCQTLQDFNSLVKEIWAGDPVAVTFERDEEGYTTVLMTEVSQSKPGRLSYNR